MTGTWQQTWNWRASLTWALVGPTLVLLIEVESALALLNGLNLLPMELQIWEVLVGGAVLTTILAAHLSTALWGSARSAQRELSERRRKLEEAEGKKESEATSRHATTSPESSTDSSPAKNISPSSDVTKDHFPKLILTPTRSIKKKTNSSIVIGQPSRILKRFGLEPSWALQQLDENLAVPNARQLTRRAQLAGARWAGYATASIFTFIGIAFSYAWILGTLGDTSRFDTRRNLDDTRTAALAVTALLLLLILGLIFSTGSAGRTFLLTERQFYTQVEALLELHRFDLYRALAVPSPHDSSDEQRGEITAWRLGSGRVSFEQAGASSESTSQQVADLMDLVTGPELIAYDGFVSWKVSDEQVELAFSSAPLLGDGYTRLQVSSSRTASHAPFDITGDSDGVALANVRTSVNAPVEKGNAARTTFGFQHLPDAGQEPPDLWFEISQFGRFIQLLRVKAPHSSSARKLS